MLIICIVLPLVQYVAIEVQNSILTGRNIAKALNTILRAQLDIGNQIEGIALVVLVIVVGKPW